MNRVNKKKNSKSQRRTKRVYETPRIDEEQVFERQALQACTKTVDDLPCTGMGGVISS